MLNKWDDEIGMWEKQDEGKIAEGIKRRTFGLLAFYPFFRTIYYVKDIQGYYPSNFGVW